MFRLCLAGVGGCAHPDELNKRLTSLQVAEWIAFSELEPLGERHRDYTTGILCSLIANLKRDPKVKKEPWKPEDFMVLTADAIVKKKKPVANSDGLKDIFRALRDSLRNKKSKG